MTMPGDERDFKQARCPHCGWVVSGGPVVCPYCRRPLRTGIENQSRGESLNEGLVWQNRQLKRSLDAALKEGAELKKRYTIDGLQPWAEPVAADPITAPTSCPRCGSGVAHDVEGVLRGGTAFRQEGPTMVRCMNDACGWHGTYARPSGALA